MKRRIRKNMGRKGSLELSANAIVILIIAITILGLALAFVQDLFGKLGGEIGKKAGATAIVEEASADRPITMPQTLELERNAEETIVVGFFNNKDDTITQTDIVIASCVQGKEPFGGPRDGYWYDLDNQYTTDTEGRELFILSNDRDETLVGDSKKIEVSIKAGPGLIKGKSTCTLRIQDATDPTNDKLWTKKGFFLNVPR